MDSAQKVITDQLKMVLSNQEQVSTDADGSLVYSKGGGHDVFGQVNGICPWSPD